MQNKGFVRVFAILLSLVCLFYLSFSVVSNREMKKAEAFANGDNTKLNLYLDSISSEKIWLGYTFKQCREMEIGLGLDLKGGMNVILEISVADVLKSLSDNNPDENFNKALAEAKIKQAGTNEDFISLFVAEYKKLDPNAKLSAIFSTFALKDKITPNSTNEEVISVLKKETSDAIDNSFNVLRNRIDRFGVVAPNIQKMAKDGQILIELPGIKEPERVRKLLQGSANLEFWETYNLTEIYPQLARANQIIAEIEKAKAGENQTQPETAQEKPETVVAEVTGDSTHTGIDSLLAEADELKEAEDTNKDVAEWMKNNPLFAKLQINQYQGQVSESPAVGVAHYADTAQINQYLNLKQVKEVLPRYLVFKWTVKAIDEKEQYFQLVALKGSNRNGSPALAGDVVTDANVSYGQGSKMPTVSMQMSPEGAKTWARLTKENIGRCIAIALDDYVYSFPVVNQEIPGGSSEISGNFTAEEANDLANVLKSGKMIARVHIVQEDVIGPSLGKEAIESGIWSFVFALVILMIYMIGIYNIVPGLIANIGLIINIFFTMGVLASFHAVLTLSGIAGLVLSLGMAVDANVLIYERAKEELRAGKTLRKAIDEAYKNAFSAIFDSNLTSIITGVVLFYFGTGPIKGFATTLIIGIISSFFVAIFLSRMAFERGIEQGWFKNLTFTTFLTKKFMTNCRYDFIGSSKIGHIISISAIVICSISFAVRGLNQGIDFSGGSNYIIRFEQPANTVEVANMLKPQFEGASLTVITIGTENQVRVSTNYKIEDKENDIDKEIKEKLYAGLKPMLGNSTYEQFVDNNIQSFQKVGPSVADDIRTGAIWAVLFSLIGMGLYILIRFRDIAFSVGTITSVAFSTFMIIGFYSLFYGILPFSMEIDQSFIAAILTVIGYSANDTVVVCDRIREVNSLYPTRDKKAIMNEAMNSTLSRTFHTTMSTAIVLLCIFLLGGDTIRSFTFAMLFGIIIGTYSTLFNAAPIAYSIQMHRLKKAAKKK